MNFVKLLEIAVDEKQLQGKVKTAASYRTAVSSFKGFLLSQLRCSRIDIRYVNRNLIKRYEQYLIDICKVTRNTSSAYIRPLKAVYNQAVKQEMCIDRSPFNAVFTGVDKTCKRAVSQSIIQRLINLNLDNHNELAMSRDLFLFSFYTRGMAFIDIAHLTGDNISNGRIIYNRHKTQKLQSVKIEQPIEEILKRYASKSRKHIFPLFHNDTFDYKKYDSVLRLHNWRLHRLSDMMQLKVSLTSYVARHSWATQAHHKHIPLKIISEALGHTKEETTIIYLESLDYEQVDNANLKILKEYR